MGATRTATRGTTLKTAAPGTIGGFARLASGAVLFLLLLAVATATCPAAAQPPSDGSGETSAEPGADAAGRGEAPSAASPAAAPRGVAAPERPGTEEAEPSEAEPSEAEPSEAEPSEAEPSEAEPSEAERIAAVRRLLEADRARRAALELDVSEIDREFEAASEEFGRIDARLGEARAGLGPARGEEKIRRQKAVSALETERDAARGRFDLVIRRRKAAREQLDALAEKIAVEEEVLGRLTDPDGPAREDAAADAGPAAGRRGPADPAAPPGGGLAALLGLPTPPADEKASTDAAVGKAGAADAPDEAGTAAAEAEAEPADDRVVEARRDLAARRDELRRARGDLELLDRALDVSERDVAATRELLDAARQQARAAEDAVRSLEARVAALPAKAPAEEAERLRRERDEADRGLGETRREVTRLAAQGEAAEAQLARLRARRPEVAERVETAQAAAASAEERLRFLESPLAPHRLWRWLRASGPRVVVVAAVMAGAWWLARVAGRRVVAGVVRRSRRGTQAEREGRAETLRRVFQNAAGLAILAVGALAILDQAGIDVTVLLGGAAVVGAAIAFGAQNLIKDYFTGFMILVENQYSVGNVVRLGGLSGSVEDITLRTTVLRDEEGAVHFVPHGQITTVTNLTHGWSRAVFAIPVGYGEDVDRVMEVLLGLAKELRDDPEFGPKTLGEPEMQGVEALGDSAVVVKFLVKTRPLQQWAVKRELLRRIKKRFDRLGIEIPFPHQTVLYRELGGDGEPAETSTADAGSRGSGPAPDGRG